MNIADMPDDELNAAVAVEVMGWNLRPQPGGAQIRLFSGRRRCKHEGKRLADWSPTTNIATAMNDVVGEMRRGGPPHWRRFTDALQEWAYEQDGQPAGDEGRLWDPVCAVLWYLTPRVICEAALAAIRADKRPSQPEPSDDTRRPDRQP